MKPRFRLSYVVLFSVIVLAAVGTRGSSLPVKPLATTNGGDTCAAPTLINSLPYNDPNGDTTMATDTFPFALTGCSGQGAVSRPGPDVVYAVTVYAGNSLTFQVTPQASYDVDIYLLGTCGNGSSCITEKDVGIEGVSETLGPISLNPGTYFFYVDSFYTVDEEPGSGHYTLSVTGSLGTPNNAKFFTLTPCRVVDTREAANAPALTAGVTRNFTIINNCNVPPTAKSVAINVTVTQPTSLGHLTLYPTGASRPLASTINFNTNQTRANNAILPLGTGGALSVVSGQASGTVHFILDVNGYFQ